MAIKTKRIYCAQCDEEGEYVKEAGGTVISCNPIAGESGFCLLVYYLVAPASPAKPPEAQRIPCAKCAEKTAEIEAGGGQVISCKPTVTGSDDCVLVYYPGS